ncbi:MAG: amino acid ABC transporter substrate-binding protein [Desulfobacteraceae bacterium]|nr:amino acid ABC transporter substrate-binding protein [Desulfobacteraceae bacterium]
MCYRNGIICFFISLTLYLSAYGQEVRPIISSGIPEAPISFLKDGKIIGVEVEILDEILKRLNVPHKVIMTKASLREQVLAKQGDIDIIRTESFKESRTEFAYYPKESHIDIEWNFFILKKKQR